MLKNWNISRLLYLAGGILFAVIAVKDGVWWMAIFGLYFVAMSVFRSGCASGNCSIHQVKPNAENDSQQLN